MQQRILIVDDDRDMCQLLNRFLTRHGFEVSETYSGKKALSWMDANHADLMLCDFRLEDMDGNQLLKLIKQKNPAVPVIIITGYSDVKAAVEVIKMGAYDYITKPLLPDEILLTIKRALKENNEDGISKGKTTNAKKQPDPGKKKSSLPTDIIVSGEYIFGNSREFQQILRQIDLVAPTNYSVIIYGESGSGKEAIAQEIHKRSKRSSKPFVAIDCGAMSKELASSELFGHERGSFTGALQQKTGSFQLANGGTIFLDEVANLPYDVQVSLLRVVQERKIRRVGGNKDIELDVRIIIASNEKLWEATRKNKFREDLYHRFNEFTIDVPPLRERKHDIMIFAKHFLSQANKELNKDVEGFTKEVEEVFKQYHWYGNLRELKNVVKRATLLTDGGNIEVRSLPFEIINFEKLQFEEKDIAPPPPEEFNNNLKEKSGKNKNGKAAIPDRALKSASIDAEFEMILEVLKQVNFNKSKAAKILNIDRKTLYNKMKQYLELNN